MYYTAIDKHGISYGEVKNLDELKETYKDATLVLHETKQSVNSTVKAYWKKKGYKHYENARW